MHMSAFASPPMFTMSRAYAMNNAQSTFEASERMYVNKFMISSDAEPAAAIRCSIWVSQCYCVGKEKAKKGREKESRDGAWNMSVQAMTRETVCYSLLVMLKIRSWGWQCTSKNYQIRIVDLPAMGKCSPKNGVCVCALCAHSASCKPCNYDRADSWTFSLHARNIIFEQIVNTLIWVRIALHLCWTFSLLHPMSVERQRPRCAPLCRFRPKNIYSAFQSVFVHPITHWGVSFVAIQSITWTKTTQAHMLCLAECLLQTHRTMQ